MGMTLEDARIIIDHGRDHVREMDAGYVYSPAYLEVCRNWLSKLYSYDWRVVHWQLIVRNHQWVEACATLQRHLPVVVNKPPKTNVGWAEARAGVR